MLPIDIPFNICGWHVVQACQNEELIKKLGHDEYLLITLGLSLQYYV